MPRWYGRTGNDGKDFVRAVADLLAARHPDVAATEQRKENRRHRPYLDVTRNAYAQTVVAPYAVRARPGAPVASDQDREPVLRTDESWTESTHPAPANPSAELISTLYEERSIKGG
ncbi:MAG TPA: hypothetical protein VGS62_07020 [Streptosporangiaceae bacterium]|nr:hypothetical protein [Streptosporangiaceae bacterium]